MERLILGPNAVQTAIEKRPREITVIYHVSGLNSKLLDQLYKKAREHHVQISSVSRSHLDTVTNGQNHQGLLAIAGPFPYLPLDRLLDQVQNRPTPLLVVLDQIQDPGNLGAIIRSARAMAADGLIITRDRSAQVTPGAIRASAGAAELLPVCQVGNLRSALEKIQQSGFQVIGTALTADKTLESIDFRQKTAIVLGNEGKGIRQLTAKTCDQLIKIPMPGNFESLNVAASAAIILYRAAIDKTNP